jgi:hypothetical protein
VDIPDVHYARAGGVAIAYQVVGDVPQTLVFSPQISDLFTIWLSNHTPSFLDRLAAEVRVVSILGGRVSPTVLARSRSFRWTCASDGVRSRDH